MREIERGAFIRLESALMACLAETTNVDGFRLAPITVSEAEVEYAAVLALMALTKGYVRPAGTKFISWTGEQYKEF